MYLQKQLREVVIYMSMALVYCLKVNIISGALYHLVATYCEHEDLLSILERHKMEWSWVKTHFSHETRIAAGFSCPDASRKTKVAHYIK